MRVITIIPDAFLRQEIHAELARIPDLQVERSLTAYPDLDEFLRTIRIHAPDFLIVDVQDFAKAQTLIAGIDDLLPGMPVVALAHSVDTPTAHQLMHMGVREYLESPISSARVREVLNLLHRASKKHPAPLPRPAALYTFFPAKPGVGTSTIALSTSCALAEELGTRTVLLDCDLAAGMINYHLKLGRSASIIDALSHATDLDEDLWRQMVGKYERLEVLHAGGLNPPSRIDPTALARILALARAQYEVVVADLASSLDEFSIDLLRESRRIFLVTTPELAPVHLAQARLKSLSALGLEDRVSLVLNRRDRWAGHFTSAVVAEAVGLPVAFCIGNDYKTCEDAAIEGNPVPSSSDIGQSVLNLAHALTPESAKPLLVKPTHKFLEFFHIPYQDEPATQWRG